MPKVLRSPSGSRVASGARGVARSTDLRTAAGSMALAALLALASPLSAAPPKLDFLFPAGVGRGETVDVTAAGTFAHWPAAIAADRPGLQVEAGEKKGEFRISADPQAAAGVYWLRAADDEGESEPRPFIVGTLPETMEAEPNDDPAQPQPLSGSTVVNGKLARRGDVDTFSMVLQKGQTLVAALEANQTLGSPMDAVLQIADRNGFVLAQNDDARGLDPLIVFEVPADGTYLVRLFAFPSTPTSAISFAGGENFVYRLTVTTGGFVDHAMPLALRRGDAAEVRLVGWNLPEDGQRLAMEAGAEDEAVDIFHPQAAGSIRVPVQDHPVVLEQQGNSPAAPQPVPVPAVVCGTVAAPGEVDAYRFAARKGQKLSLRVQSHALGFPLDGVLQIADASGKVLAEVDDTERQRDPSLAFTAPADGGYDVLVRDLHRRGGLRFAYRLTIAEGN